MPEEEVAAQLPLTTVSIKLPLFVMTSAQAWDKIQHNKVRLYTTFMESSVSVWQSDLNVDGKGDSSESESCTNLSDGEESDSEGSTD